MNKEMFEMCFELENIISVQDTGYKNTYDIHVSDDSVFLLQNGVVSHNSQVGGILPALGREEIGYYTLKGKPLNVITQTHQKFIANKELSELYQIIQNEGYEQIVTATDSDLDQQSIKSLLAGFIWKMLPEYKDKFYQFNTPVKVIVKGESPVRWTYSLNEELTPKKGEQFNYMKGLGSWDSDELQEVIKKDGFDTMVQRIEFDEESDKVLLEWLDKDSEPRKKYILANNFSIAKL